MVVGVVLIIVMLSEINDCNVDLDNEFSFVPDFTLICENSFNQLVLIGAVGVIMILIGLWLYKGGNSY